MRRSALVVGATGIVGGNLADHLSRAGWQVYGLARRRPESHGSIKPISADLLNLSGLRDALHGLDVTHLFICTWSRQATEAENCVVNGAMMRNLLVALEGAQNLRHAALVTGLKHYLGPFEAFAKGRPETPFREEQPRLPVENFYYVQEDMLFDAADRRGFSWSVHRPHTVIGYALGNAMNMGVTLAAYATICRETGRPFVFPGSPTQWEGLTDVTDARVLAMHLEWAATTDAVRNQALNVVNGDIFRWQWLWPQLAACFGLEAALYPGRPTPLQEQMQDVEPVWREIASRHGLVEPSIDQLASWWHTDADLGREIECVTDMSKSRRHGFLDYQYTPASFFDLFTRLRDERVIP